MEDMRNRIASLLLAHSALSPTIFVGVVEPNTHLLTIVTIRLYAQPNDVCFPISTTPRTLICLADINYTNKFFVYCVIRNAYTQPLYTHPPSTWLDYAHSTSAKLSNIYQRSASARAANRHARSVWRCMGRGRANWGSWGV